MAPTSPDMSPSSRRPWWHYVLGGCGCLGATAVILLVVLALAGTFLVNQGSDMLIGGEEGKAHALQTAEDFLDAAEATDGDKALGFTNPSFQETYSTTDLIYIIKDVHLASKRGERHFLTSKVHLREVDGRDDKVALLFSLFEYRTDDPDDTPVCLVVLADAAVYDDTKVPRKTFQVHSAGCGEKATLEASL